MRRVLRKGILYFLPDGMYIENNMIVGNKVRIFEVKEDIIFNDEDYDVSIFKDKIELVSIKGIISEDNIINIPVFDKVPSRHYLKYLIESIKSGDLDNLTFRSR